MRNTRSISAGLVTTFMLCGGALLAQVGPPACTTTLGQLDAKVRSDYAGYLLEVRGASPMTRC